MRTIKRTLKVHEIFSQDDPPLPEDDENKEKRTDDISSWDADFLKVYKDDDDNHDDDNDFFSWAADFPKVDDDGGHDDDFDGDIFSRDADFLKVWTFLAFFQPCANTSFLTQVDQGTLFELILAANYLDIKVSNTQESIIITDDLPLCSSAFRNVVNNGVIQHYHLR